MFRHQAAFDTSMELVATYELTPTDQNAQSAADSLYVFLDAVSPDITDHTVLDNAENGTEGLLRDRSQTLRANAIGSARSSIEAIREMLTVEGPLPDCSHESDERQAAASALTSCEQDSNHR